MVSIKTQEDSSANLRCRCADIALTILCCGLMGLLYLYSQNKLSVLPRLPYGAGRYEQFLLVSHTLLLIPLIIALPLSIRGREFGFGLGTAWSWKFYGVFVLCMVPVLWFASARPDFRSYYPIYTPATSGGWPLGYHLLVYSLYLFSWELLFRGVFTHASWRVMGYSGVLLQALVFAGLHWGKPMPEVFGSLIAGIAMGLIAIRGRSFLPGFAAHAVISALMDIFVVWRNLHPGM